MHYMKAKDTILRDIPVITYQGPYVHMNRNMIVHHTFRRYPLFDYLLMVDSDALWPDNVIERIQGYDRDQAVVTGLSFGANWQRSAPHAQIAKPDGTGFTPLAYSEVERMVENPSLYKIDAGGVGCTAIRRDVFEKLAEDSPAWFEFTKNPKGIEIGEDIGFCMKVAKAGYSMWVDSALIYKHVALFPYDEQFYLRTAIHPANAPLPALKHSRS
jgi:hypothetical protein